MKQPNQSPEQLFTLLCVRLPYHQQHGQLLAIALQTFL
jgi:hypothetical protein